MPTEPVITQTEETVETKTVTTETTTPVSETAVVEQKTDTVTNEDGSTTIITETTTTTTTESETTTTTETTITTTDTYEVKSEGSYVTDSEEVADYIAAQEKEKQKEIKADVEEKGGSYEYNVEITDKPSTEHIVDDETYDTHADAEPRVQKLKETENVDNQSIKIVPTKTEEERQADLTTLVGAATDLGGTINEDVTKVEQESTVIEATFDSLDKAKDFLKAASEVYKDPTLAERDIYTSELKGKKTDDDDVGYTSAISGRFNYNTWCWDLEITITITGAGLEEIDVKIPGEELILEPADGINAKITIINEAEDQYVIDSYSRNESDALLAVSKSFYEKKKAEYGENIDTEYAELVYQEGNKIYVKPNNFQIFRDLGRDIWRLEYVKEYCKEHNIDFYNADFTEKENIMDALDTDDFLAFYNEKMGTDFDNFYDAYNANFKERGYASYYDEEEKVKPDDYWKERKGTVLPSGITIYDVLTTDGEVVDNLYQSVKFMWAERLVLKAVHNYKANLEIDDVNYKVEYDEINHTYEVEVAGLGTYTVKEEEIETEETKLTVVDVKTETVVEKETVPPTPDQPVVPVIPNIPFFPAEIGNNPQGDLLEIDDFMTPLAGSLIMNEGDCIN